MVCNGSRLLQVGDPDNQEGDRRERPDNGTECSKAKASLFDSTDLQDIACLKSRALVGRTFQKLLELKLVGNPGTTIAGSTDTDDHLSLCFRGFGAKSRRADDREEFHETGTRLNFPDSGLVDGSPDIDGLGRSPGSGISIHVIVSRHGLLRQWGLGLG